MRLPTALLAALVLLLSTGAAAQSPVPGFSKAFSPSTIGPGSVTTLTFTLDNTGSSTLASGLTFSDVLPAGMTIASPAAATTTCLEDRSGPVDVSAPAGGTTIAVSSAAVAGGTACQVSVNVTSTTPGVSTNTSGDLTSSAGNSGTATANLTVDTNRPGFTKAFAPATVVLGGQSTLTFTIDNTANGSSASNLAFSDTLPAGMAIASPANAATTCSGATVQAPAGGSTIAVPSFPTGSVPANGACTVSVDVVATAAGALGNVSGELTSTVGFSQVGSGKASAVLTSVVGTLGLAKSFLLDPVPPGGTVPLEFTLRNIDRRGDATAVAFTDNLGAVVPGLVATGDLPAVACGGTVSTPNGGATLVFSGGELASSEVCTFTVDVAVPAATPIGAYTNVTSGISGEVLGDPVAGSAATAPLFIQPVPLLTKSFLQNPVSAGAAVTLEFTLTNSSATATATALSFTDDLSAIAPLAAYVTPQAGEVCGVGSSLIVIGGTSFDPTELLLSMGSLDPGASCTFSAVIELPLELAGRAYANTTSAVTAQIDGQTFTGAPATDVLTVLDGPELTKEFLTSPVLPGAEVTLAFTLELSDDGAVGADDLAFTDDLGAALAGLAASPGVLPISGCGGDLTSADGGQTLSFSGGSLSPGETCELSLALTVPSTAGTGTYTNVTSALTSTVGGVALTGAAAEADLVVTQLSFAKAFTDDPVAPGGTVTLEYTLTNQSATDAATGISFSDDYDAALDGLVATAAPANPVCTTGTATLLSASRVLSVSGASLAPGETCTFSVALAVPGSAVEDAYPSPTSALLATIGSETVAIAPAVDDLLVGTDLPAVPPTLTAAFVPPTIATGATSQLVLTVDNLLSGEAASALAVTATLATAVVINSPNGAASTCGGTVTAVPGSNALELAGGSVAAGTTCTISVSVVGTSEGMFLANTSTLESSQGSSPAASAKLTVEAPTVALAKTDALDDSDGDGLADAGETIAYTVVIEAGDDLTRPSTFTDTPGTHTTLVAGSVAADAGGTVVSGNGPGDTSVEVSFGSLTGPATVTFEVTVDAGYPAEATEVCNQATFAGDFPNAASDDPDTAGFGATCTPLAPPNRPPVADAGADRVAECSAAAGAAFALDGSGSSDEDGDLLTYTWTGPFPEGGGTVTGVSPTVTLPLGVSTVTLTVTDPSGATDTDEIELTVEDTTPPTLTVGAAPLVLWPPNHAYHTVDLSTLSLSASDVCDTGVSAATTVVTQVSSDEPENGSGDGNTVDDIVVAATCDAVDVRAERKGNGNGRVYVFALGVADASGNVATGEYEVQVPKNSNQTAVRDAPQYTVLGCSAVPDALAADGPMGADTPAGEAATAVAPQSRVIPEVFALGAAYPNPMDRSARVRYDVPVASAVRLEVFDTLGRRVALLADGAAEAGSHEAVFYAHRLPAGTYLIRFTSEAGFAETRPVTVLR